MVFLSGLKPYPYRNVKNGCHEEIPAKLDGLTAHDGSCVFQKVPCPDCEELVIFKDLGQKHLKQDHVNDCISVYYETKTNEYNHSSLTNVYGIYNLQAELINGRKYYKKNLNCISWDGKTDWCISKDEYKGLSKGFAYVRKDVQNLHKTTDWKLLIRDCGFFRLKEVRYIRTHSRMNDTSIYFKIKFISHREPQGTHL